MIYAHLRIPIRKAIKKITQNRTNIFLLIASLNIPTVSSSGLLRIQIGIEIECLNVDRKIKAQLNDLQKFKRFIEN